jgi:hypothetical protein
LALGEIVARGVSVGVTDLSGWTLSKKEAEKAREEGKETIEWDGFLGAEHLYLFGAIIDCRQRRMWVDKARMAKA